MIPAQEYVIRIKSPVMAECGAELARLIKPILSFPSVYYTQGMYRKERKETSKSVMVKGKIGIHYFWAGLVDRIMDYCKGQDIKVTIIDESKEDMEIYEPELLGITFRPDQLRLLNNFLDKPRGILVAPTGSGKTVLGFGCLSAFPQAKALWLCHKKTLLEQTYDEAKKFGFRSVGRVGDGYAEYHEQLTIATRQSFRKLADEYGHYYDIVVVDETHHVASIKSEYAYVLTNVPAPIRLGLTATLPREGESYLTAVGLIGPVVGEMTINEGAELGILATPRIKIIKLPKNHEISQLRQYSDVYSAAVVCRKDRNERIAAIAKSHADQNETVLIMINHIEHGERIQAELEHLGVRSFFVRGSTESDARSAAKKALTDKSIHVVICSSVWTEGINIPTLNVVIAAAGGKAEIGVLQSIGRGLRKTKDKEEVFIYDFFDGSHKYLIEHFGERICLYSENNWI